MSADDLSYGEALAELESLLSELEDDLVDIDTLAAKVRRAQELHARCKVRIAEARMEVDRIVGSPGEAHAGTGTGGGEAPP